MAGLLRSTCKWLNSAKLLTVRTCNTRLCRNATTSNADDNSTSVVLTDDGSAIVCWHPEKEFPYEHSKPVPRFEPELNETDSVLKVQNRLLHKHRFRPDGPTKFELQKLTYTTKHVWYPRKNEKRKNELKKYWDRERV